MAAVLLPGIGPVLAAGIISSTLGGAMAGTAVGGILGAMSGLGFSQEEADYYNTLFYAGKAILAVRVDRRIEQAKDILRRHGGYNMYMTFNEPVPTDGPFTTP
jgi:hypothetical protein